VGGPWFSVHETGADWKTLDTFWFADGPLRETVRIELRVTLDEAETER